MDLKDLAAPFPPEEVKFRKAPGGKGKLAYIDARAVFDRLDAVVGPGNWQTMFTPGPNGGVLAAVGIRIDNEWVWKWDGAENTRIEAIKGGLSDAIKRAAVQWGVGRYLYRLDTSGKLPAWALPQNVEDAEDEDEPPKKPAKKTSGGRPEVVSKLLEAFVEWGAFQKDIERLLGKKIDDMNESDISFMRKEFAEMKDMKPVDRKERIMGW